MISQRVYKNKEAFDLIKAKSLKGAFTLKCSGKDVRLYDNLDTIEFVCPSYVETITCSVVCVSSIGTDIGVVTVAPLNLKQPLVKENFSKENNKLAHRNFTLNIILFILSLPIALNAILSIYEHLKRLNIL